MRTGFASLLVFTAAATQALSACCSSRATISIGQPTVYRRERSLIERFDDLEWLRRQRSPEKEAEYDQGFQGSARIGRAEFTGFAAKVAIGEQVLSSAPSTPPPDSGNGSGGTTGNAGNNSGTTPSNNAPTGSDSGSTGGTGNASGGTGGSSGSSSGANGGADSSSKKDLDTKSALAALAKIPDSELGAAFDKLNAATPTLLPRDKFVNRLGLRDTVAEEIRRRSLDDTHDLEGMSLYELQFDLSIASGDDAEESYAVMLQIKPCECMRLNAGGATRVIDTLRADCLSEITETTTRFRDDGLTIRDSTEVNEAVLRGSIAARHAELERLLAIAEALEQLAKSLPASNSRPQFAVDTAWRAAVNNWDATHKDAGASAVRDRILLSKCDSAVAAKWSEIVRVRDAMLKQILTQQPLIAQAHSKPPQEDQKPSPSPTVHLPHSLPSHRDLSGLVDRWNRWKVDLGGARTESLSSASAADLLVSAPERSIEEEKRIDAALEGLAHPATLSKDQLAELRTEIERGPSRAIVAEWACRALGFAIARHVAKASGGALSYVDDIEASGLDATALIPVLLRGNECSHTWDMPNTSDARVVSVAPSEIAEQITSSTFADVRRAFSLALGGLFTGTITSANAAFDRVSQELRRYELIARNGLVVGFVGGDTSAHDASNTFGWLLGPRYETGANGSTQMLRRHGMSHYPVSATVIAPATLQRLELTYRAFRIDHRGRWLESDAFPATTEGLTNARSDGKRAITVSLPTSPELLAEGMLASRRWNASQPRILAARALRRDGAPATARDRAPLWQLQAGQEPTSMTILGTNLWRNPQVYVGGQRATQVQILSDLGGLWAQFDKMHAPAGSDGKPVREDLVVSTSRGTDRLVGAVEIFPPKADTKQLEPKALPSVQLAVARNVTPAAPFKVTIDLHFELAPPLSKTTSELHVRARRKGAAAQFADVVVDPRILFMDPKEPGKFDLRSLVLEKPEAWEKIEILEVLLQSKEGLLGEPRNLHAAPLEVVVVQDLPCTSTGAVVAKQDSATKNWTPVDASEIQLKLDNALPLTYFAVVFPDVKPGKPLPVQATIADQRPITLQLSANEPGANNNWLLKFPTDALLANGAELPKNPTVVLQVGKVRLATSIAMNRK